MSICFPHTERSTCRSRETCFVLALAGIRILIFVSNITNLVQPYNRPPNFPYPKNLEAKYRRRRRGKIKKRKRQHQRLSEKHSPHQEKRSPDSLAEEAASAASQNSPSPPASQTSATVSIRLALYYTVVLFSLSLSFLTIKSTNIRCYSPAIHGPVCPWRCYFVHPPHSHTLVGCKKKNFLEMNLRRQGLKGCCVCVWVSVCVPSWMLRHQVKIQVKYTQTLFFFLTHFGWYDLMMISKTNLSTLKASV